MTSRSVTRGKGQPTGSHYGQDTQPGSFAAVRAAFKSSKIRETLLDVLQITGAVALVCSVAGSIPVFLFLLFLCEF
jgi:hypothetical protein